jgi:hypothetical protein
MSVQARVQVPQNGPERRGDRRRGERGQASADERDRSARDAPDPPPVHRHIDEFFSVVTGVPKPIIDDGFVTVPDRPGLGFEYDLEALKKWVKQPGFFDPTGTTNGLSTAGSCSGQHQFVPSRGRMSRSAGRVLYSWR